jgi:hypothetical protein
MKTSAFFPIGTASDQKSQMVNKGDILELADGMKVAFVEMKRTKFVGKDQQSETYYQIPI